MAVFQNCLPALAVLSIRSKNYRSTLWQCCERVKTSLILSFFAVAVATEEVRQLQYPRWRVLFQFEIYIRTNCMLKLKRC